MNKNGKHTRHMRRVPLFSVSIVLLLAVILTFGVFLSAKYISARKNDTVATARPFYFESNYLAETNTTYTLKEGVDTISFELYNYADDLRYSEVDIAGTVTLSGPKEETKEITLGKGSKDTETVSFSGLAAGSYTVTAVASPYYKKLEATFVVRDVDDSITYSVNDNAGSPFLKVEVTNGHYDGKINITWPSGVRPDNTDELLTSATGTSCQVDMKAYSSYTFLFFKDDPSAVYDSTNISVTKAS